MVKAFSETRVLPVIKKYYSPARLSLLLTILAVVLWSVSLLQANLTFGFYGSIHSYSVTYFIALGMLTLASFILWISKDRHDKLLCFQLCLFITSIWLTPLLIGNNALWADHVYRDFAEGLYISQYGHINPTEFALFYHNWPGTYIIEALLIDYFQIENVKTLSDLSECLIQFIILVPLFAFLKNVIKNSNHIWAGCWLFFLGNWTAQFYFNPQGIAIILLLAFLMLVTNRGFSRTDAKSSICLIILFAALTITHLITSMFALLIVFYSLYLNKNKNISLITACIIFIAFWTISGAAFQFEHRLPNMIDQLLNFDAIFSSKASDPTVYTTESVRITTNIRILFMSIFLAIAGAGLFISFNRETFKIGKHSIGSFFKSFNKADLLLVGIALIGSAMMFFIAYGTERFIRAFIFCMPAICYLGTKLLNKRLFQLVFCLLIVVLLPLRIISYDAYQANIQQIQQGDHAYHAYLTEYGQPFLANNVPTSLYGGLRYFAPGYYFHWLHDLEWENTNSVYTGYIHLGEKDRIFYEYGLNYDPDLVDKVYQHLITRPYNYIYSNNDTGLYFYGGNK